MLLMGFVCAVLLSTSAVPKEIRVLEEAPDWEPSILCHLIYASRSIAMFPWLDGCLLGGAGAQGTITINVSGSQTALSGSFSVRHGQVATSVPELAATPHPHLMTEGSGGSLIKVRKSIVPLMTPSKIAKAIHIPPCLSLRSLPRSVYFAHGLLLLLRASHGLSLLCDIMLMRYCL